MSVQLSFSQFLTYTPSQKEVSLVIAKDAEELATFHDVLGEQNYRQVIDAEELVKRLHQPTTKAYYVIRHTLPKEMYDFLVQYPTGQVELFNTKTMKKTLIIPSYEKSSIIFLVTKETLLQLQNEGYSIKNYTGLAYQN